MTSLNPLSGGRCKTCNRLMGTGVPTDNNCGGDCSWCMAYLFADPDELAALEEWRKVKRIEQR